MASVKPYVPRGRVTFYLPTDTPPHIINFLNRSRDSGVLSHEILEALDLHVNGGHSPKGEEKGPSQEPDQQPNHPLAPSKEPERENLEAMARIRAQSKRIMADPSLIKSTIE